MKCGTYLRVLVTLAAALCATPALSGQIVGLSADSGQGNCYPFGCSYSGGCQQVYTAGAFSAPILIGGLQFFNTQQDWGATEMLSGNWTIALSTTSKD